MSRHLEVAAIAASGLHRIEYRQNNKHGGLVGLGSAIATVCAGLPHARGTRAAGHRAAARFRDVVLTAGRNGRVPQNLAWEQLDGVTAVRRDITGVRLRVGRESTDALLFTALQHGWSVETVTGTTTDHHRTPNSTTNGDMR